MAASSQVIGSNLRRLRKEHDYTLEETASLLTERGLAIGTSGLCRMEYGQRRLKLDEAVVVADLYGVQIQDLLRDPVSQVMKALRPCV